MFFDMPWKWFVVFLIMIAGVVCACVFVDKSQPAAVPESPTERIETVPLRTRRSYYEGEAGVSTFPVTDTHISGQFSFKDTYENPVMTLSQVDAPFTVTKTSVYPKYGQVEAVVPDFPVVDSTIVKLDSFAAQVRWFTGQSFVYQNPSGDFFHQTTHIGKGELMSTYESRHVHGVVIANPGLHVYTTTDHGLTFQHMMFDQITTVQDVKLAPSPTNSGKLVLAWSDANGDLYTSFSLDDGRTWQPVQALNGQGLEVRPVWLDAHTFCVTALNVDRAQIDCYYFNGQTFANAAVPVPLNQVAEYVVTSRNQQLVVAAVSENYIHVITSQNPQTTAWHHPVKLDEIKETPSQMQLGYVHDVLWLFVQEGTQTWGQFKSNTTMWSLPHVFHASSLGFDAQYRDTDIDLLIIEDDHVVQQKIPCVMTYKWDVKETPNS